MVAGTGGVRGYDGDGGPATEAKMTHPFGICFDASDNMYIADTENHCYRRVDSKTGIITTIAGNGEQGAAGDGGPAKDTQFTFFGALVYDREGNLLLTSLDGRIRKIDARTQIITTIAGKGERGFSGDSGPALEAQMDLPYGMALDNGGNIYFCDARNDRVRMIDRRTGMIRTIAGIGNKQE